MIAPDRRRFARAIRRLSTRAFVRFVAALWAAQGWRTTQHGCLVTAERGDRRVCVLVCGGITGLVALRREPSPDVIVARGRLVSWFVARVSARPARDGPVVLAVADLYEPFAYAIDATDRAALERQYFGRDRSEAIVRRALAAVGERLLDISRAQMKTALAVVVVLSVTVVAGPIFPVPSVERLTTADQPVNAAPSSSPTPTNAAVPAVCPTPEIAHPAALRPSVRTSAAAFGLDGWTLRRERNVTAVEFDPNDQTAGIVPEIRHVAVYTTPTGAVYRLVIDRWESPQRAKRAIRATETTDIAWGRYAIRLQPFGEERNRTATAERRALLSAVTAPNGPKLGRRCVAALAG